VAVLIVLLIMVLLALVVTVVGAPLRARRAQVPGGSGTAQPDREAAAERRDREALLAELRAAREAKYQEIRDAELDFRTGKLSQGDFEAVDAGLRAEAIAILDRLQEAERAQGIEAEGIEDAEDVQERQPHEPRDRGAG
jgi:hypothetical protein